MTRNYIDTASDIGPNHSPNPNHLSYGDLNTDTVIIGNGPAALFLSFLLHGNVPYYDPVTHGPHPDPVLHRKLLEIPSGSLYEFLQSPEDVSYLTEHFPASQLSYSTQAQRINVLLDTLLRPNADLDIDRCKPRIRWVKDDSKRVAHLVIGSAPKAGGQWSENPIATSLDIGTLSYADMLSLPGYTFFDHYHKLYEDDMPVFTRPTRRDVSSYYAQYPKETGMLSSIGLGRHVYQVERTGDFGFLVRVLNSSEDVSQLQTPMSYAIRCKHVVLASGIFTRQLSPPPPLQQIPEYVASAADNSNSNIPMLVVGSGFTAADVLLSAHPNQEIIHIFKWNCTGSSLLKGCHPSAYPEYAMIYRMMKLAANNSTTINPIVSEQPLYEGFPNAEVISITPHPSTPDSFEVTFKLPECSTPVTRQVGHLAYFVGRRGDLSYLSPQIQAELGISHMAGCISGDTLRARVAANAEVTKGIFAIGSLTGDSLVKFGFGSGTYAAGRILYKISQMSAIDGVPEIEVPDCGTSDFVDTPFSLPSLASSSGSGASGITDGEVKFSSAKKGCIERDRKMSTCSTHSVALNLSFSSAYRTSKDTCIIS
ncbi:hypothetical protein L211DRAFT_289612 [Terfezia boudieri ATCC MYA-4762]|uniref:L-ornithine N(5)-oxygenase n=1 Tax=Terfezia boudieri ATCC MYA-4762 TaxID=1051890 RepID=A0A3N4LMT9_9PEZI|nr:hypothetical protein L211DRAFT_289612 [Terfezia boudieri ATCC MYA-4762]